MIAEIIPGAYDAAESAHIFKPDFQKRIFRNERKDEFDFPLRSLPRPSPRAWIIHEARDDDGKTIDQRQRRGQRLAHRKAVGKVKKKSSSPGGATPAT